MHINPTRFGRYQVRSVIAQTAMSSVYEAWDERIGRRVAIKSLAAADLNDTDGRELLLRFARGARAAGMLNHRNIVSVYDYAEQDGMAYLVMEFIDGVTLKKMLEGGRVLPTQRIAAIMADVLQGLAYSHDHGVVHRDMKPANIMVTATGEAKITDFGIARIERSDLTQAGTVMGSPAYMSPEQFRGEPVDLRTDIYSAGVILYQMLTGRRPYEGSLTTIMHKALHTDAPVPSSLSSAVPTVWDAVVRRAMAKHPDERFASARSFEQAIATAARAPAARAEAFGSGDATVHVGRRPAGALRATRTSRSENRRIYAAAASLAGAAIFAGAWFVPHWTAPGRHRAVNQQQTASTAVPAAPARPAAAPPAASAPGDLASAPVPSASGTATPSEAAASSPPAPEARSSEIRDAGPAVPPQPSPAEAYRSPGPLPTMVLAVPPVPEIPTRPQPAVRPDKRRAPDRPTRSADSPPANTAPQPQDTATADQQDHELLLPAWLRRMAASDAAVTPVPPSSFDQPADTPAPPADFTAAASSPLGLLYRWSAGDGTPAHRRGLEVIGVTIGSPAYVAGIRHGDRIIAVDGRPITDPAAMGQLGSGRFPEHATPIELSRDGKVRTVAVVPVQ